MKPENWGPPWRRFRSVLEPLVFLEIAVLRESPHLYEGRNRPYVVFGHFPAFIEKNFEPKLSYKRFRRFSPIFFWNTKTLEEGFVFEHLLNQLYIYIYCIYCISVRRFSKYVWFRTQDHNKSLLFWGLPDLQMTYCRRFLWGRLFFFKKSSNLRSRGGILQIPAAQKTWALETSGSMNA